MKKIKKFSFCKILIHMCAIFITTSSTFADINIQSPQNFVLGNQISDQLLQEKKLPIGMNIPGVTYYDPSIIFTDAMKTANFRANGIDISDLSSSKFSSFPVDDQGYPTQVPYTIEGHQYEYIAYFNSFYTGEYALLYDGVGQVSINGVSSTLVNGVRRFTLPGVQTNIWVRVASVTTGDHVRNIRIIPVEYLGNENSMPTFRSDFLAGLQPFHALRSMDLTRTNNSINKEWSSRTKKNSKSQGGIDGVAWEYIVELSNKLGADPWICVPHQASDDYITQLATLLKTTLNSDRKIYLEFSNELWNWPFSQAGYVNTNAPGHPNSYVSSDLAAIQSRGGNFPEKDAYMMARIFKIFMNVWGSQSGRIVRVATGQAAWADNSRRILKYLFETDGIGADALAVGGYFYFNNSDHAVWNAMNPAEVTPGMILQSANDHLENTVTPWVKASAAYAKQYGVQYLVYEGGQHMQPYNQQDWGYNHAVYSAQIDQGMYALYNKNFALHLEPDVNCKLFMAFSYVGTRVSRYGSWGHIENLNQLASPGTLMNSAPKYKALLDINANR